jgi:hypothetical protein
MKEDRFQIRVMQNTPEGIVIRRFEIYHVIKNDEVRWLKPVYLWTELQRVFNDGERSRNYRLVSEGYQTFREYWTESKKTDYTSLNGGFGYISYVDEWEYVKNINEVISNSPLKYAKKDKHLDYYGGWLKQCEYLEKIEMNSLVENLINGRRDCLNFKANSLDKFLRIPKDYIKMVKDNDFGIFEIHNLRWLLKEKHPKITPQIVKDLPTIKYNFAEVRRIVPNIDFTDYLNYINKTSAALRSRYHYDYLDFCKKLNYDMTSKEVLYPHNLEEAHDREMARVKIVKDKQMEQKVANILQEAVKKHNFATNEMFIRVPKTMKEIIDEGAALTHCVGNYCDRVADGLTMILFVRKQSEPDIPFYTVEFRDNKTIQIRGKKNIPPTLEVAEFMKEWENRNKKKTKQKIKVAI